jgi:hypothetical protein
VAGTSQVNELAMLRWVANPSTSDDVRDDRSAQRFEVISGLGLVGHWDGVGVSVPEQATQILWFRQRAVLP